MSCAHIHAHHGHHLQAAVYWLELASVLAESMFIEGKPGRFSGSSLDKLHSRPHPMDYHDLVLVNLDLSSRVFDCLTFVDKCLQLPAWPSGFLQR